MFLRLLPQVKSAIKKEQSVGGISLFLIVACLSTLASSKRPLDNLRVPGYFRAQILGSRFDSHPAEIQTIGVPAGLDSDISFGQAVAMVTDGED